MPPATCASEVTTWRSSTPCSPSSETEWAEAPRRPRAGHRDPLRGQLQLPLEDVPAPDARGRLPDAGDGPCRPAAGRSCAAATRPTTRPATSTHGAEYVILGEGEITLGELLDSLEGPGTTRPPDGDLRARLPGGRRHGDVDTGRRPSMRDLDALPFPAWDLVDVDRYRAAWARHGRFSMNMVTTRGCPFHCNWCAKPIWGQRYAVRSPAQRRERAGLAQGDLRPGPHLVRRRHPGSEPGLAPRVRLDRRRPRAYGPRSSASAGRTCSCATGEIEALKAAGCEMVWVGAESGSQRILDAMEKGTRVEQIHEAAAPSASGRRPVRLLPPVRLPGRGRPGYRRTRRMVLDCLPDDIGISVSYPLPGTPFYERVRAELGERRNWLDSADLAMLYRGPYSTRFYRRLHTAVHKEYRLHRAAGTAAPAFTCRQRPRTAAARHALARARDALTLPVDRAGAGGPCPARRAASARTAARCARPLPMAAGSTDCCRPTRSAVAGGDQVGAEEGRGRRTTPLCHERRRGAVSRSRLVRPALAAARAAVLFGRPHRPHRPASGLGFAPERGHDDLRPPPRPARRAAAARPPILPSRLRSASSSVTPTSWCRARRRSPTTSGSRPAPSTSATATRRRASCGMPGTTSAAGQPAGAEPAGTGLHSGGSTEPPRGGSISTSPTPGTSPTRSGGSTAATRSSSTRRSSRSFRAVERAVGAVPRGVAAAQPEADRSRCRRGQPAGLPLDIIGEASGARRARRLAGPTVRFLGRLRRRRGAPGDGRAAGRARPGRRGLRTDDRRGAGKRPTADRIRRRRSARDHRGWPDRLPLRRADTRRRSPWPCSAPCSPTLDAEPLVASARRFDVATFRSGIRAAVGWRGNDATTRSRQRRGRGKQPCESRRSAWRPATWQGATEWRLRPRPAPPRSGSRGRAASGLSPVADRVTPSRASPSADDRAEPAARRRCPGFATRTAGLLGLHGHPSCGERARPAGDAPGLWVGSLAAGPRRFVRARRSSAGRSCPPGPGLARESVLDGPGHLGVQRPPVPGPGGLAVYALNEIHSLARPRPAARAHGRPPVGRRRRPAPGAAIARAAWLGELVLDPRQNGVSVVATSGTERLLRAYGLTDHPNILGGLLVFGLLLSSRSAAGRIRGRRSGRDRPRCRAWARRSVREPSPARPGSPRR